MLVYNIIIVLQTCTVAEVIHFYIYKIYTIILCKLMASVWYVFVCVCACVCMCVHVCAVCVCACECVCLCVHYYEYCVCVMDLLHNFDSLRL